MTIIMGVTLANGAALAGDTLRHNAKNGEAGGRGNKTVVINNRVIAAKAGYGPDADSVWEKLRARGVEDFGVSEVVEALRSIGEEVYNECKRKAEHLNVPDPGLYLFVAGLEKDGTSSIHWLNFKFQEFDNTSVQGSALAIASRDETSANALNHLIAVATQEKDGIYAPLDTWAKNLTRDEIPYAPHAIDFPLTIHVVTPDGVIGSVLHENDPPIPELWMRLT